LGSKGRTACKADNLTTICELTVQKGGSLDVSQSYGPSQHVTGIDLDFTFYIGDNINHVNFTSLILYTAPDDEPQDMTYIGLFIIYIFVVLAV
jgi:hypothetical protein